MNNSHNPHLNQLMEDVEQAAALVDIECNESIWPIMQTFEKEFLESAVGLRITTKAESDLNVRYITLGAQTDPYAKGVAHKYITPTNHPVYRVIPELRDRFPEASYTIDLGVTHGIEKIWGFYSTPMTIDYLCDLAIMPPSLGKHLDLYKHYGLDWVSVIGVDYLKNTLNVYWMGDVYPHDPDVLAQMVEDMGFPRPSDEDNAFNIRTFSVYTTYSWDSDAIERISFAGGGPAEAIPAQWDAQILRDFANAVPLRAPARTFAFNTCYGRGIPNYYKIEADYRMTNPQQLGPVVESANAAVQTSRTQPAAGN